MQKRVKKRASAAQRIGAFLGIILAIGIGFYLGGALFGGFGKGEAAPKEEFEIGGMMVRLVVGLFFLMGAVFLYAITLLTQCFTFGYGTPVFRGFRTRLYIANTLVMVGMIGGIGFIGGAVVSPLLALVGLPPKVAVLGFAFLAFIATTLVGIWAPMDRPLVKKRLRASEVPERAIEKGQCMGLSYPQKSSLFKFTSTLDDVGMLWFLKSRMVYRGDVDQFEIRREEVVEVERKVDKGNPSMIGGGVPVVLTFREGQKERKVRLIPGGCWTVWSTARALDDLADKIERWKDAGDVETGDGGLPAANGERDTAHSAPE